MELEHIVKKAVRRWAEKIASKRAQRQARMALPNGSDLSKRKAGRLGVAGSVAGHIEEITVAESQPEAFTRPTSRKAEAHDAKDNAPAHLDHRLAAFAEERYDLRHNLLTGQAEFRPKGQDAAAFLPPHGTRPQFPLPHRPRGGHPVLGSRCVTFRGLRPTA